MSADNEIKIAPYAPLLEYKKGYTPEFVKRTFREKNLIGLRIFAHLPDERLSSLDFLKDYTFLEVLHINVLADLDYSFLNSLTNLKELSISGEGKSKIDLGGLVNLEKLIITWRKSITGIDACTRLGFLSLYGYKEKNMTRFSSLVNLKKLQILTSGIESLEGLEKQGQLEDVVLGNCRKLKDIRATNGWQGLKKIEFDACAAIFDFSPLGGLASLQTLKIRDCKVIKSIGFINDLPALTQLALLGNTEVSDGDLRPAVRIKELYYSHRKHYNIKVATPRADELEKANMAVIRRAADKLNGNK